MTHNIRFGKTVDGKARDSVQKAECVNKAGTRPVRAGLGRKVNLCGIARDHHTRAKAHTREKHLHLFACGILGLVKNDKGIIERTAAHKGERSDLNDPAFEHGGYLRLWSHIIKSIVERAQIRVHLVRQIAGEKAEPLARFHRRACQHDTFDTMALEHRKRHGHSQIGLARAGRAYGKNKFIGAQRLKIGLLRNIARCHGFARRTHENRIAKNGPEVEARIVAHHGIGTRHILFSQDQAAAQKRIKLDKNLAEGTAHIGVVTFNKKLSATTGNPRTAGSSQHIKVCVTRPEQQFCKLRIVKFHQLRRGGTLKHFLKIASFSCPVHLLLAPHHYSRAWHDTCINLDESPWSSPETAFCVSPDLYGKIFLEFPMSISGISNYRDVLFQWQGQQLKSTGSETAKSSTASSLSSLFSGSSITNQLSSMVELTKYAMDAMGLASNSRVTFSQISRYREQLQSEFSQAVRDGLAQTGIHDLSGLTFSLDNDGKLSAVGANAQDRTAAQAWLDANPGLGTDLRAALQEAGVDGETPVEFRLSTTGRMSVVNSTNTSIQSALDGNTALTKDLRAELDELGISLTTPLELSFDEDGNLAIRGDHDAGASINQWLKENPTLADAVKEELEKRNVGISDVSLRLAAEGNVQIAVSNGALNDIQAVLDKNSDAGKKLVTGLDGLGVDPNITFSLQIGDDGSLTVISDHTDRDKVQRFFDENPELVKKYRQIEALSGIDDARKAMQLAPSDMRKRIQIESMASWWADSGSTTSYFGAYSEGNLSLLSGLNLSV